MAKKNPAGGSGKSEGRDGWCTPKWLTDLIGTVHLDPCSNGRSTVKAAYKCGTDFNGNGLLDGKGCKRGEHYHGGGGTRVATDTWTVYCNPPYAHGQVIRWVRHYRHTRFIYLLRWDPSTEWFAELMPHTTHVWFPRQRINFEPPPGVKASSNPFPHALYLRQPSEELLKRLEPEGYLFDSEWGFAVSPPDAERKTKAPDTGGRDSGGGESPKPAKVAHGSRGDAKYGVCTCATPWIQNPCEVHAHDFFKAVYEAKYLPF